VATAIGADAFAFVLWNLTARTPLQVARDIATALGRLASGGAPGAALYGTFHLVVGLMLLSGGALLILPLVGRARDFVVLETLALIAALAVDQLVGPELRRFASGRQRS
jgi:hypothetical protein